MMTAAPAIFVWRTAAALWLVRRYRSLSCLKRSTCLIQHRMWSMHIFIDESRAPCLICVTKGGIGGRITCHWLLPGDREPRTIYWILGNQLCCVLRSHDFPSTGDSEGVEYRGTDNSWVSVRSGWDAEFEIAAGTVSTKMMRILTFQAEILPFQFNNHLTKSTPSPCRWCPPTVSFWDQGPDYKKYLFLWIETAFGSSSASFGSLFYAEPHKVSFIGRY